MYAFARKATNIIKAAIALQHAGIKTLNQLAKHSEKEILALHGMGPASMPTLRTALKKEGLAFKK